MDFDFGSKKIKVNGHVFEVQRTDMDVLEKANMLMEKYEKFKDSAELKGVEGLKAITSAVHEAAAFTDEMLGEGAMKKIFGGKPVGLGMSIKVMRDIARCVIELYSDEIDGEFAIDTDGEAEKALPGQPRAKAGI